MGIAASAASAATSLSFAIPSTFVYVTIGLNSNNQYIILGKGGSTQFIFTNTTSTVAPTLAVPTHSPTNPTTFSPSATPSRQPSNSPTNPTTFRPSSSPSRHPTTHVPTTQLPSRSPSTTPTKLPSRLPSMNPTLAPTLQCRTAPFTFAPTLAIQAQEFIGTSAPAGSNTETQAGFSFNLNSFIGVFVGLVCAGILFLVYWKRREIKRRAFKFASSFAPSFTKPDFKKNDGDLTSFGSSSNAGGSDWDRLPIPSSNSSDLKRKSAFWNSAAPVVPSDEESSIKKSARQEVFNPSDVAEAKILTSTPYFRLPFLSPIPKGESQRDSKGERRVSFEDGNNPRYQTFSYGSQKSEEQDRKTSVSSTSSKDSAVLHTNQKYQTFEYDSESKSESSLQSRSTSVSSNSSTASTIRIKAQINPKKETKEQVEVYLPEINSAYQTVFYDKDNDWSQESNQEKKEIKKKEDEHEIQVNETHQTFAYGIKLPSLMVETKNEKEKPKKDTHEIDRNEAHQTFVYTLTNPPDSFF